MKRDDYNDLGNHKDLYQMEVETFDCFHVVSDKEYEKASWRGAVDPLYYFHQQLDFIVFLPSYCTLIPLFLEDKTD